MSDKSLSDTGGVRPLAPPRCSTWLEQGEAGMAPETRRFYPEVSEVLDRSARERAATSGVDCRRHNFRLEETVPIRRQGTQLPVHQGETLGERGLPANRSGFGEARARPFVSHELGVYRGDTCLETFLARYDNCARYYEWTEVDRRFYLCTCLQGPAGQVLWNLADETTSGDIVRWLRKRYGQEGHAERHRAELRGRKRKSGESLQALYTDICRLMSLAFVGPSSAESQLVGRDAFLDALQDPALHVRILEREPKDVEDAYNIASRLEMYDLVARRQLEAAADCQTNVATTRTGSIHPTVPEATSASIQLQKQLSDMHLALSACQMRMQQQEVELQKLRSERKTGSGRSRDTAPGKPNGSGRRRSPPVPIDNWKCFGCRKRGSLTVIAYGLERKFPLRTVQNAGADGLTHRPCVCAEKHHPCKQCKPTADGFTTDRMMSSPEPEVDALPLRVMRLGQRPAAEDADSAEVQGPTARPASVPGTETTAADCTATQSAAAAATGGESPVACPAAEPAATGSSTAAATDSQEQVGAYAESDWSD